MNRRTFLRRGMAGGAVLILGAGGLAAIPTKDVATPTRALVVLSKRSFQVLVAFATRVLPWGSGVWMCTGMTACSGSHTESKPRVSARLARVTTSSVLSPAKAITSPTVIMRNPPQKSQTRTLHGSARPMDPQ